MSKILDCFFNCGYYSIHPTVFRKTFFVIFTNLKKNLFYFLLILMFPTFPEHQATKIEKLDSISLEHQE